MSSGGALLTRAQESLAPCPLLQPRGGSVEGSAMRCKHLGGPSSRELEPPKTCCFCPRPVVSSPASTAHSALRQLPAQGLMVQGPGVLPPRPPHPHPHTPHTPGSTATSGPATAPVLLSERSLYALCPVFPRHIGACLCHVVHLEPPVPTFFGSQGHFAR